MDKTQWLMKSQIGPLYIVASANTLEGVYWSKQSAPLAKSLRSSAPSIKIISKTLRQLEEYFAGKRTHFDLPFDPPGTEFQKQVWKELSRIPYGKTCSYAELARKIGRDKAVRAVGTANGRNPLCIVVPCHRVIASSGSAGGYAGGPQAKSSLIKLEQQGESRSTLLRRREEASKIRSIQ